MVRGSIDGSEGIATLYPLTTQNRDQRIEEQRLLHTDDLATRFRTDLLPETNPLYRAMLFAALKPGLGRLPCPCRGYSAV